MIVFIIMALLVFSGVFTGFGLTLIAPEEVKIGNVAFYVLAKLMFLIALVVVFYSFRLPEVVEFMLVLISLLILVWLPLQNVFYYIVGAVMFAYASGIQPLELVLGTLLFVYGIALAGLEAVAFVDDEKVTGSKGMLFRQLLLKYLVFPVVAVIAYVFIG